MLASPSRATTYRDKLAAEGPSTMTDRGTIPMTVHRCAGCRETAGRIERRECAAHARRCRIAECDGLVPGAWREPECRRPPPGRRALGGKDPARGLRGAGAATPTTQYDA